MSQSYLIFDTETTGLPTDWNAPVSYLNNWPRLVQIAWTHCDNSGNILSQSDYIIKPQGFIIPEDAANVHGISTEKANNEGIALSRSEATKVGAVCREATLRPSLSDLHCKLFGVDFEEAHDAAVDVRACTSCLFELKNRGILIGTQESDTSAQDELLARTWIVPSDSDPSKTYTVQYSDYGNQTILKCNCPAWKFNTRKNRTCKHTDYVVKMHDVPQAM